MVSQALPFNRPRQEPPGFEQRLHALLDDLTPRRGAGRIAVKSLGRVYLIPTEDIDWLEAAGNYIRIHVGAQTHLLRETMNRLEDRLDPARFVRIHRSTIVNVDRIRELQRWFHGDYPVPLRDGTQLTMSRSHRRKLHALCGQLE